MQTIDRDAIIKLIKGLWPKWENTVEQEILFAEAIEPYEYEVCKQIIRQYRMSKAGQYYSPKIHDIVELVKKQSRQNYKDGSGAEGNEPCIVYKLQCIANKANSALVGYRQDFYIPHLRNKKPFEFYEKEAEYRRASKRQGDWVVVRV